MGSKGMGSSPPPPPTPGDVEPPALTASSAASVGKGTSSGAPWPGDRVLALAQKAGRVRWNAADAKAWLKPVELIPARLGLKAGGSYRSTIGLHRDNASSPVTP